MGFGATLVAVGQEEGARSAFSLRSGRSGPSAIEFPDERLRDDGGERQAGGFNFVRQSDVGAGATVEARGVRAADFLVGDGGEGVHFRVPLVCGVVVQRPGRKGSRCFIGVPVVLG
ncbi:MAG: hypothetical protein MPK62_09425 [Alphaproteobacteria bacterium]|nr:hypothetical protein [Alphaproteobacteria bacterium]